MTVLRDDLTTTGIVIEGPHQARLAEFSAPRPADGALTVRVELCGVCTPEQRVYRGTRQSYPYWGGHELSAIVEEAAGDASTSLLAPGTRVAIALMPRCGSCYACRRGLDNHCAYLWPRDGSEALPQGPRGFSTRLVVPPYQAFAFPPEIPAEIVALTEPLACCLRSIAMTAVAPGDVVSVHGCGTMGRLHAAALTRMGCRVVMSDADPTAREGAGAVAGLAISPVAPAEAGEAIGALSGGAGARAAFCTRGGGVSIAAAIAGSARGGSVVLYQSLPAASLLQVDINDLHYREIRLVGSIAQSAADLARSRDLLVAHPDIRDALAIEVIAAEPPDAALARSLAPEVNRVMIDFR